MRWLRRWIGVVSLTVTLLGVLGPRVGAPLQSPAHATVLGWNNASSLQDGRAFLGAATGSDGRIYAVGGFDAAGVSGAAEAYNPGTNSWSPVAPIPGGRVFAATAAGLDGNIYVFGGQDSSGAVKTTVEMYSPSTQSWSVAGQMPSAREFAAAATAPDGRIYVVGGYDESAQEITNTVEAFDPQTGRWNCSSGDASPLCADTSLPPLQKPRYGLAAAFGADGRLYAIGGVDNVIFSDGNVRDPASAPVNTVEAYRPGEPTWGQVASLPIGRAFLAAVESPSDGLIYAIGGADALTAAGAVTASNAYSTSAGLGNGRTTVEAFGPSSATWQAVPSLSYARGALAAAVAGDGSLVAIGGYDDSRAAVTAAVERYPLSLPPAPTATTTGPGSGGPPTLGASGATATASSTATSSPTSTPTPTNSASPTATSTATLTPTSTVTATPSHVGNTVEPTVRPNGPGAASRPTAANQPKSPLPTLLLHLRLLSLLVRSGSDVVVDVTTAAHAQIHVSIQVRVKTMITAGKGRHRKSLPKMVVRYSVDAHGTADAHGRYRGKIHISYTGQAAIPAVLRVSAQALHRNVTLQMAVTIEPAQTRSGGHVTTRSVAKTHSASRRVSTVTRHVATHLHSNVNALCTWSDSGTLNFQDPNAHYWLARLPVDPGVTVTISGTFPAARFASIQAYTNVIAGTSYSQTARADLLFPANPGSTNPFLLGGQRGTGTYTLYAAFSPAPSTPLSNTLYLSPVLTTTVNLIYRVYLPDNVNTSDPLYLQGHVPLPTISYTDPSVCQAPPTANVQAAPSQMIPSDVITATGVPTFTLNVAQQLGGYGNYYSAYLRADPAAMPDLYVVRFQVPSTPRTLSGQPFLTGMDLRYWSLCMYDLTWLPFACPFDEDVGVDSSGYATIVMGPWWSKPANATSPGVTWVNLGWDTARTTDLFRQTLPSSAYFKQSAFNIPQINSTSAVTSTMGPYAPIVTQCSRAQFEATKCSN